MRTLMRSSMLAYTCLFLLTVQMVDSQPYGNPAYLTPPTGNSPQMTVKTVSAYVVYTCVNGAWIQGKGYAKLVDKSSNEVVGNYTCGFDKGGQIATWTILNSPGDAIESGDSSSSISGRPVATSYNGNYANLPSQLLEAVSHENFGAVSSVSYAQMYSTVGGAPPPKELCSSTTVTSKTVPFRAEFCLWTQDAAPPSVPASLTAPGRVVEGFFGKGFITYQYSGSGWVDSGRAGVLSPLPGTPTVGNFWVKGGVECWDIYNPNGFTLYGELTSFDKGVATNACPWSLSSITSESSSAPFLGPFSHVQMTSTRGGMIPLYTSNTPQQGAVWNVPFTAVYWFTQHI